MNLNVMFYCRSFCINLNDFIAAKKSLISLDFKISGLDNSVCILSLLKFKKKSLLELTDTSFQLENKSVKGLSEQNCKRVHLPKITYSTTSIIEKKIFMNLNVLYLIKFKTIQ